MTAYNIVRLRVKPGCEEQFIAVHRNLQTDLPGFKGGALVNTGERSYCMVGEWASFQRIVDARPKMIGMLDGFRDLLEDLGNGLGLTDPVSGEAVVELKPKARGGARKAKKAKTAKRKVKKAAKKKAAPKKAAKAGTKKTAKKTAVKKKSGKKKGK